MANDLTGVQTVSVLRSMGGLVFDAVFEESHESELQVTDNPVETGVIVSDHAFMKPLRLSITAGVTATPLRKSVTDPFGQGDDRPRRAFELLTELQSLAEPFDVQTGFKLYKNMVCTSIRTAQDKATANAFVFSAELREVLIVNTHWVSYRQLKDKATKQQASKKKEKGEQQGKVVTNTATKKKLKESLSSKAGVGAFFGLEG